MSAVFLREKVLRYFQLARQAAFFRIGSQCSLQAGRLRSSRLREVNFAFNEIHLLNIQSRLKKLNHALIVSRRLFERSVHQIISRRIQIGFCLDFVRAGETACQIGRRILQGRVVGSGE